MMWVSRPTAGGIFTAIPAILMLGSSFVTKADAAEDSTTCDNTQNDCNDCHCNKLSLSIILITILVIWAVLHGLVVYYFWRVWVPKYAKEVYDVKNPPYKVLRKRPGFYNKRSMVQPFPKQQTYVTRNNSNL